MRIGSVTKLAGALALAAMLAGCGEREMSPNESFGAFQRAAELGNMEIASALATAGSMEYLARLQDWVVFGDGPAIAKLPDFDRYFVLRARALYADLDTSDWEAWGEQRRHRRDGLNVMALRLLPEALFDGQLGETDRYAEVAGGPLVLQGREAPVPLRLVYERGWKVDLIGFARGVFDAEIPRYRSERYAGQEPVDAMLKDELGGLFAKTLYQAPVSRE